jgi:hypothetical protein
VVTINFLPTFSRAQNLIPNPGFELYDSLPCNFTTSCSDFASHIVDWFLPTAGTSDIVSVQISSSCAYGNPLSFQSCGPHYPRSGDAMVAMVAASFCGYEEYVEVQLSNPLISGHRYYFEGYILLGSCSNFSSNNYGTALSVNEILDTVVNGSCLNLSPVVLDSTLRSNSFQWEKFSGCFVADSAYEYLVLGHFANSCDSSALHTGAWPMSYYFIDDVFLAEDSTCDLSLKPCQLTDNILPEQQSIEYFISGNSELNLQMKGQKGTVVIYSSVGKKIQEKNFTENLLTVDISYFAQGLYIAVLFNPEINSTASFKFVKY